MTQAPVTVSPPLVTQLAPAFVALAGAGQPDGVQRLTIRLDPAELGQVSIQIDRKPGESTHVHLAVERTDTLMTLLQDRPRLDRALDLAGIPPEGRTIQFSLSPPPDTAASPVPTLSSGTTFSGSMPGGGNSGGGNSGGQGSAGNSGQDDHRPFETPIPARTSWLRAGIDITA